MNADQLIQYLSWVIYLLIFVRVTISAVRRPLRANIDIALLFAVPTGVIVVSVALMLGLLPAADWVNDLSGALLLALPYMLLRLVDDFSDVPPWLLHTAEAAMGVLVVGTIGFQPTPPALLTLLELVYLIVLLFYAVGAFGREARRASGVTRRRMWAAAAGSISLGVLFVVAGLQFWVPALTALWQPLNELAGLASGVCYFLGFAPPGLLRRAWQEPELRAFLGRAAHLPRLPTTAEIVAELERGAATALGAPHARIGLWDEAAGILHFTLDQGPFDLVPDETSITGRSFLNQQPAFTDNLPRDNPATATGARTEHVQALLAAPITAGETRLGILTVYAPRAPIFADEDLALVTLLADQAAVVLESRALIDEATRVRAREEVTRLKDDFLSAAAHDLKTPLTTIVAQAQLLEKKARLRPDAPADLASIERLVRGAERMKTLVLELLDSARAEQGQLVGEREAVDLVAIAQETCAHHHSPRHPCHTIAAGPVTGVYDRVRMMQLIENLVENAIKYSPDGGPVEIHVWQAGDWNQVAVTDHGIGIPPADLPHVFERFHRGTNVDDRRLAGMGLGLFICRGIAEQHGGRIAVSSVPGSTTFSVMLPVALPAPVEGELAHA